MTIEKSELLQRLQTLAPFEDEDAARRAFSATLKALRRGLFDDEATWLAVHLGSELAAPLLEETHAGELSVEQLYQWMGRFADLPQGIAREQAQASCRALTELLPASVTARLRSSLPQLADLLGPPEAEPPSPEPARPRDRRGNDHTLAGGRAGSERPLYAARPESRAEGRLGVPVQAHSDSIAVSDDPHSATKLSTSRGLTQERERRSLSTARPGRQK